MDKSPNKNGLVLLIGLVFILLGCSQGNLLELTFTPLPNNSASDEGGGTPDENSSIETLEAQATPLASSTFTDVIEQITLVPEESKKKLLDLLRNNGGCDFPCLLGFQPDVNDSNDYRNKFTPFGWSQKTDSISGDILIKYDNFGDSGSTSLSLVQQKFTFALNYSFYAEASNLEQLILIATVTNQINEDGSLKVDQDPNLFDLPYIDYFKLPQILEMHGPPKEIYILPFPNDTQIPDNWEPFSLILLYQEQNTLIEYVFQNKLENNNYVGCPNEAEKLSVVVQSSTYENTISEYASRLSGDGLSPFIVEEYKKLSDATSLTIEDFEKIYSDQTSDYCLQTPIELWR
ncbi:MAG: hypothetical protein HND51_02595 [Chloroflexi bacterium]|nr:hypothetical protein [Chloroflexota bacterium]